MHPILRRSSPLPFLALAACATVPTTPPPTLARTAGSPDDAFDCGIRQVNELGYVVTAADRASGFLRAERDRTSLGDALMLEQGTFDQLTLTAYRQADGRTVLRVIANTIEEPRGDGGGSRATRGASPTGHAAAQTILAGCGEPVVAPGA